MENGAKNHTHTRINNSILSLLERPALNWLADRMPAWVTPDLLTGIGLFASFLIFIAYTATMFSPSFLWLASFGYILNWFGDSLDGTLARKRKIERPLYGFFVDHYIDALSTVLIFVGLGFSPYVRFEFALITLIGYLLLSIYTYLSTYVNNVFRVSFSGLGPTEIRMIGIAVNTLIFFFGNPQIHIQVFNIHFMSLFDIVAVALSIIIFGMFIIIPQRDMAALREKENQRLKLQQPD